MSHLSIEVSRVLLKTISKLFNYFICIYLFYLYLFILFVFIYYRYSGSACVHYRLCCDVSYIVTAWLRAALATQSVCMPGVDMSTRAVTPLGTSSPGRNVKACVYIFRLSYHLLLSFNHRLFIRNAKCQKHVRCH